MPTRQTVIIFLAVYYFRTIFFPSLVSYPVDKRCTTFDVINNIN
jgi:hypothetical protein